MLFLVRHGRPLVDRSRPAHEWELDPAGVRRHLGAARRPAGCPGTPPGSARPSPRPSPPPSCSPTARSASSTGLREHERDEHASGSRTSTTPYAARSRCRPRSAVPGWEPLAACRDRVVRAVDGILARARRRRRRARRARHRLDRAGRRAHRHGAGPRPVARAADAGPRRRRAPTIDVMSTDKQAVDEPTSRRARDEPGRRAAADGRRRDDVGASGSPAGGTATTRRSPPCRASSPGCSSWRWSRRCSSAVLSLVFDNDRAEDLFPFVLVTLVVPLGWSPASAPAGSAPTSGSG